MTDLKILIDKITSINKKLWHSFQLENVQLSIYYSQHVYIVECTRWGNIGHTFIPCPIGLLDWLVRLI